MPRPFSLPAGGDNQSRGTDPSYSCDGLVYGHGVVHCNGPGHKTIVLPKLPQNRHYQMIGCTNKTIIPSAV
jgi:hypothetical protein